MKKLAICLLLGWTTATFAAPTATPAQPPAQGCPPPPQAFESCKGKKAGDAVQHVTPSGQKIAAICTASPQGLFALPACDMTPPPHHTPPPSAFADCKGKKEGAVIQHKMPSGEKVAASCTASPQGLFARPDRPPHPPR
ncbi:MAG: hypothetical protein PHU06_11020 [Gallionella sp.]|nr:hypothetical protein [Gallionella sp.]MDD4959875.1 hypothetical protein [Gallionella sp.]